jgi:hypothetical protein
MPSPLPQPPSPLSPSFADPRIHGRPVTLARQAAPAQTKEQRIAARHRGGEGAFFGPRLGGFEFEYERTVKAAAGPAMVNANVVNAQTLSSIYVHFGEFFRVFARNPRSRNPVKYKHNYRIKHKIALPACRLARVASKTSFKNKRLFTLMLPKGALPRIVCGKGSTHGRRKMAASCWE